MRFYVPYATPHGPSWYPLRMPVVRMVEQYSDPPSSPAPYSSLFKDVKLQGYLFRRDEGIRANALFPVRLKAGQTAFPNGGSGLQFAPDFAPEVLGGAIISSSV